MPNYEVGSVWRKWDLHVHTPASLVQHYPGNGDAAWDAYIADLEKLPADVKVLGINDYIFIDGYRRLRDAKANQNRLKNIDLLLPVIELRLNKFGGTTGALRRVNFHIIFSDEIDPDVIETHFLNALPAKAYVLTPEASAVAGNWKALPTKGSLADLGASVIASVPEHERHKFKSALEEGFNNLNFGREAVLDVLDSHYFRRKYLTAVGKTEWWDIKWNDNTIADKKTIINGADLSFVSAESPEAFAKARTALLDAGVRGKLLDCSDAHYPSSSAQKDRIGKCFTWISADTTFAGLKHALLEYDSRVFVGDLPAKLGRVNDSPMNYVQSVTVRKVAGSTLPEKWFDYEVPLNPGLVAVIGNKGSGKSALADTIGFLSHSRRSAEFSFLHPERFLHPRKHKAEHFEGTLRWISGEAEHRNLAIGVDPAKPERVQYIPQKFLERLCNGSLDTSADEFERVLKEVIYSHVPVEKRLGQPDMQSLIRFLTTETEKARTALRAELHAINANTAKLEADNHPDNRRRIQGRLDAKQQMLSVHDATKPTPVPAPPPAVEGSEAAKLAARLDELRALSAEYRAAQNDAEARNRVAERQVALFRLGTQRLAGFERTYQEFVTSWNTEFADIGVKAEDVAKLQLNNALLKAGHDDAIKRRDEATSQLDASKEKSPASLLKHATEEIRTIEHQLGEPARQYRAYLEAVTEWDRRRKEIIGAPDVPDTIESIKSELGQLANLPAQLEAAARARADKTMQIFASIAAEREVYSELYATVQKFITDHPLAPRIRLQFSAEVSEVGFVDGLFGFLNRTTAGSFRTDAGAAVAKSLVAKYDLGEAKEVAAFLEDVVRHLTHDKRGGADRPVAIEDQLRKDRSKVDLFDFLFGLGYLSPRYSLTMDNKLLSELSPGERGTLLLIFFLLVDKSLVPLIIDQPEENLDNQTVVELLVPAIGEARRRRQVIMVTHNPNLAVVCDADQVISAELVRAPDFEMKYESGAIEHLRLNKRLLDVLEGTDRAFSNRDSKYKLSAIAGIGA